MRSRRNYLRNRNEPYIEEQLEQLSRLSPSKIIATFESSQVLLDQVQPILAAAYLQENRLEDAWKNRRACIERDEFDAIEAHWFDLCRQADPDLRAQMATFIQNYPSDTFRARFDPDGELRAELDVISAPLSRLPSRKSDDVLMQSPDCYVIQELNAVIPALAALRSAHRLATVLVSKKVANKTVDGFTRYLVDKLHPAPTVFLETGGQSKPPKDSWLTLTELDDDFRLDVWLGTNNPQPILYDLAVKKRTGATAKALVANEVFEGLESATLSSAMRLCDEISVFPDPSIALGEQLDAEAAEATSTENKLRTWPDDLATMDHAQSFPSDRDPFKIADFVRERVGRYLVELYALDSEGLVLRSELHLGLTDSTGIVVGLPFVIANMKAQLKLSLRTLLSHIFPTPSLKIDIHLRKVTGKYLRGDDAGYLSPVNSEVSQLAKSTALRCVWFAPQRTYRVLLPHDFVVPPQLQVESLPADSVSFVDQYLVVIEFTPISMPKEIPFLAREPFKIWRNQSFRSAKLGPDGCLWILTPFAIWAWYRHRKSLSSIYYQVRAALQLGRVLILHHPDLSSSCFPEHVQRHFEIISSGDMDAIIMSSKNKPPFKHIMLVGVAPDTMCDCIAAVLSRNSTMISVAICHCNPLLLEQSIELLRGTRESELDLARLTVTSIMT
eukprot:m.143935 g.143935  ORF g.143935 m.143935 type:complete len:670 (-) comp10057_c0_seq2:2136-4145(-)